MAIEILIEETRKQTIRSLFDARLGLFPDAIATRDTLPLSVGIVDRIGSPWNSRKFTPQSLASTTFRAALGGGFILPVAGSYPIAYGANATNAVQFDADAGTLEMELNLLASIISAGGIDVSGEDGFFAFTFRTVGARTMLSGDASDLVPLSLLDFQRVVTGDASTKEVQTLRILQNAGAIASLSTAAAGAALALTNPQDGGAGLNEQYRVTITGGPYKGSWTLTKGAASGTIQFDDTEAQIQTKLAAISTIGTGNVNVTQEDERTYLIEFIGSLANTAVTVTANGANLTAIPELTGTLDLRGIGTELLMNGSESKVVTLEIEKTVGSDPPVKILQRDVLLVRPVLEVDMTQQFLGTSQQGLTSIGSGVDSIAVVFPRAFTSAPTQVIAIIEKPSGGDNIFATVRRDTISTTGFTAELSGTTPDANHKLSWIAIA